MSRRSRETSVITVLAVLTIALPVPAGYRDDSKAISVSGGEDHTLAVTANNRAWSCGPNGYRVGELIYYFGVLGIGSSDPDLKQKALVKIHGPGNVGYLEGICDVGAGWQHSLALDVNDSVWNWGWNSKGQLGVGDDQHRTTPVQVFRGDQPDDPCQPSIYLKHITAISAGRSGQHSLAVDTDGHSFAWGYNQYGQCGNDQSGNFVKDFA
jgi:alpha-tubulin suppressor-like RCC1 family protein